MVEQPGDPDFERRGPAADLEAATAETYLRCFHGPPWHETDLTLEEVLGRLEADRQRRGFDGLWLQTPEGVVIAASWYDRPDPETLLADRGPELRALAETHYEAGADVVWIRETIVNPDFQGLGLAKRIKTWVHERIEREAADAGRGVLFLTKMREDNPAIIAVNRGHGYQPTGIRMESSQSPGTFHEYWYRELTVDRAAASPVS